MMEDQAVQSDLYRPGPYWSEPSKRIRNAIEKDGIENFRSNHAISKGYADSILLDPLASWGDGWKPGLLKRFTKISFVEKVLIAPYLKAIQAHYNRMSCYRQYYYNREFGDWLRQYVDGKTLPDTMAGAPQECIEIKGVKISINYITHLLRIYNFSKEIDLSSVRSVFEVGGGYGANAHLLLHLYPNIKKYLYLDIPPIVYIATQYLKHFYPSETIDYLATRGEDRISFKDNDERQILAVCPWQIENVECNIDLFYNSASFQEMEQEAIYNYLRFADKFSTDENKGNICLAFYRGGDLKKTRSIDSIISVARKYYEVDRINPEKEELYTLLDYYTGSKKKANPKKEEARCTVHTKDMRYS